MASIQTVMTSQGISPRMLYYRILKFKGGGLGPKTFYDSPPSVSPGGISVNFSWLNKRPTLIPSPQMILNYQRQSIQAQARNHSSSPLKYSVINTLNAMMRKHLNIVSEISELFLYGGNLEERVKNGTVGLIGVEKDKNLNGITYEGVALYLNNYNNVLTKMSSLLADLNNSVSNGFGTKNIAKKVQELQKVFDQAKSVYEQGKTYLAINPQGTGHLLQDGDENLIHNMTSIAYQIRWQWLESAVYETAYNHNSAFVTSYQSLKPYQLGQIKLPFFDLFNNKKLLGTASSRSDTALINLDKLSTDLAKKGFLKFEWEIKNDQQKVIKRTGTIIQFLDDIEQNYTKQYSITFNGNGNTNDIADIMSIFYQNLYGFQVKSGVGKNINFLNVTKGGGRQLTVEQMLQYSRINERLIALNFLYQLKNDFGARITEKSKYYSALYNYNLGHFIYKIIGEENQFIVTANGIETVTDWVLRTMSANSAVFHSINQVSILAGASGPGIAFGKLN